MNVELKDAILHNSLPIVIPAVEYQAAIPAIPAIPATETEPEIPEIPEIPEVLASPKKYLFKATVFSHAIFAPADKFIQADDITFITENTEDNIVTAALTVEATIIINNYNLINI